jgi:hypothetical protein
VTDGRRGDDAAGGELTRRCAVQVALSAAGAASLAGCSALPADRNPLGTPTPSTIEGRRVRAALEGQVPTIPAPGVLAPGEEYLQATRRRVTEALAAVPTPLGPSEIPNAAVRAELSEYAETAREALSAADGAPTSVARLEALRRARERARAAAAGWRAIEGDLTVADVIGSAESLLEDVATFRTEEWRYLGEDPVAATVVHARLETLVEAAIREPARVLEDPRRDRLQDGPVGVARVTGSVVAGRAALADARHYYARFRDTRPVDRSLRPTFRRAGEYLTGVVDARVSSLSIPDEVSTVEGRDVSGTPIGAALDRYGWAVEGAVEGLSRERDRGKLASVVLDAGIDLRSVRAYESMRDRAAAGEYVTVDTASDVERLRSSAIAAIETALEDDGTPRLTRRALSDVTRSLVRTDRELDERAEDDTVRADLVVDGLARYVSLRATAEATPSAMSVVATALADG